MLIHGFIQKKYEYELKILSKYYFSQNIYENDLRNKVLEFCNKHMNDFNEVRYIKMIKRVCRYGENNSLFIVKPVRITQCEIDKIKTLNNLKIEKIAFVLLVLANINKQSYILYVRDKIKHIQKINNKKNRLIKVPNISLSYYINEKINSIFKLAKIYLKKDERNTILRILIEREFIIMTKKCKYKINFIKHNTEKNSVIIYNFDDFVLEYERIIGDNIGYCIECKKPIRIRGNNHKMCSDCWKKHRKEYINNKVKIFNKKPKK